MCDLTEDHVADMTDPLLLLWDVDGTLLQYGGAREHAAALIQALREVYRVDLPDDAVQQVRPMGKTDRRIAREVLAAAGLEVDPGDEWIARLWELYREADLGRLRQGAMAGADEALSRAANAATSTLCSPATSSG